MKYFILPKLETCLEAKRVFEANNVFSTEKERRDRLAKINLIINEIQKGSGVVWS